MAAILGRTDVGVREIGRTVVVPNDPKARLMYYLHCLCYVLDLSDTDNLSRLRNHRQHYLLSEDESNALVAFCIVFSPDVLLGKVIFQDDSMCGDSSNKFFEISAVRRNLLVSDSIIVGGQRRAVSKIMFCKHQWLVENWNEPMEYFTPRLARIIAGGPVNRAQPARAISGSRPQPARAITGSRPQPACAFTESRAQPARAPAVEYNGSSSSDGGCCCAIL